MATDSSPQTAELETGDCCAPSCCGKDTATPTTHEAVPQVGQASEPASEEPPADEVRRAVREGYGKIARSESQSCCGSSCGSADSLARGVGYSASDLENLPESANMGLSCGNPTALAQLQPGETVLDLGSGGGFDIFIAGEKVGAQGRAIGVDMTADMIDRARNGIAVYSERTGLENVEFRLGEIEHLPLADESVDVVISNCVINLSPHKPQVWREIARVLKPGGRVAVSDLALKRALPQDVTHMVEALVGCVAGAALVSDTQTMVDDAGLVDIELEPRDGYVDAMADWHDPLYARIIEHLPEGETPADYVTSLAVSARKPVESDNG